MRAVVQRVRRASVVVDGETTGAIERGLLVYLGLGRGDTADDRAWVLSKIAGLRIFTDAQGKMSLDLVQVGGALLLVSQFTLFGDVSRGRRPSFDDAMPPDDARAGYEAAIAELRAAGVRVETGRFGADMLVSSDNDGPVTLWLDSRARR